MEILASFDEVFKADPGWPAPPCPTDQSLAKICRTLNIVALPPLLIQLALEARHFGVWFAGLGPDFESGAHILAMNQYFRNRGLSSDLILLTYGFDDVCDCLDMKSAEDPRLCRVVQTHATDDAFSNPIEFAPTFEDYLEKLVRIFGSKL